MNRWTRAQVALGTLVTVEVEGDLPLPLAHQAMDAALARIAHIGRVMSAHDPYSDLGRLSRAQADECLELDPHTVQVLQAAQEWFRRSGGAFNPVRAAHALVRRRVRPGLSIGAGHLNDIEVIAEKRVRVAQPVAIDLGGIAKGYAVDQAMRVLREHQITQARVNAGGDLAVMGHTPQRIALRHAGDGPRSLTLGSLNLQQGAVATSVAAAGLSEFVPGARQRPVAWRSATVRAPDCMTADALTKWALQSSRLCPQLQRVLREQRATLWRSR